MPESVFPISQKRPEFIIRDTFRESWEKGWLDPVYFYETFLGRGLHNGQIRWTYGGRPYAKERCWAAANRIGKTEMAGLELARRSFYQVRDPKFDIDPVTKKVRLYTAISISMSLDQARLAWNVALTRIADSPKMKNFLEQVKDTPFPVFTLSNGKKGLDRVISETWARSTAKKARYLLGRSFNFINYDEPAWDPDGEEIMDNVIRMRLVDQAGEIDMMSAPNGKNWFYKEYLLGLENTPEYGGKRFYSQTGITLENTFIPREEVLAQARRMSKDMVRQNIFGEFIEFASVFPYEDVARCYRDMDYSLPVPPHHLPVPEDFGENEMEGGTRFVFKKSGLGRYVVGCDLGRKLDPTCIIVLRVDQEPAQIHEFVLIEKTRWEQIYARIKSCCDHYNAPVMIDATAIGDPIQETLLNEPYNLKVVPFIFATKSKENLILQLQEAIQKRRIQFPYIHDLVRSLTMYQLQDRKLFTDPVMALALAWKMNMDLENIGGNVIPITSTIVTSRYFDYAGNKFTVRTLEEKEQNHDPLAEFWNDEEPANVDAFEDEIKGSVR